jgi:carbon monoxide dehydrogenase subunit G
MDLSGEQRIAARREIVWAALNNPEVLCKCIPGCESMEPKSATQMAAVIKLTVGPVSASFKGDVTLSNLVPLESYTLTAEGSGGVLGMAKAGADVRLTEDGDATILTYAVNARIGGRLAMLGSMLVGKSSKTLAEKFFKKFNKVVSKQASAAA